MAELSIGTVARRARVSVDTVRDYERLGIVPAARRRPSGYRGFDEATVDRLALAELVARTRSLATALERCASGARTVVARARRVAR